MKCRELLKKLKKDAMEFSIHDLMNVRVFLEKDNAQLSEYRELFRYVKIPKTKKTREIFINQEMIKEGFGRSFFDKFNKFYQNDFNKIQQTEFKNSFIV